MKKFMIFLLLSIITAAGCATLPENEHNAIQRLLPSDTTGLLVLEMEALFNIPLFKDVIEDEFLNDQGYKDLKNKYNFDLTREVALIALAMTTPNPMDEEFEGAVFMFLKNPRPDIFEAILAIDNYKELPLYKGVTLYQDEEDFVFAFLEERVLLGGTLDEVKDIIDSYKKHSPARGRTLRYILKNKNSDSVFWGGMLTPGSLWENSEGIYPGIGSLGSIENLAFSVDMVDQNTYLRLNMESMDQGFNKQIVDILNGLMLLGRMADQDRELVELFDNLSFQQEPDGFTMLIKVTEGLMNLLEELNMEEFLPDEAFSPI